MSSSSQWLLLLGFSFSQRDGSEMAESLPRLSGVRLFEGNVDLGLINPCLSIWVFPSKSGLNLH